MSDDTRRLEEKIAYLEHHVTEQDKVMWELGDQMARLRREIEQLKGRIGAVLPRDSDGSGAEERPPHY